SHPSRTNTLPKAAHPGHQRGCSCRIRGTRALSAPQPLLHHQPRLEPSRTASSTALRHCPPLREHLLHTYARRVLAISSAVLTSNPSPALGWSTSAESQGVDQGREVGEALRRTRGYVRALRTYCTGTRD